jgi:hypothetical protein
MRSTIPLEEVLPEGGHILSNLPYNVGTALLVGWLGGSEDWPPRWASLTLMFQKEVAERIVAASGSDAFGRLASSGSQWRSSARIAMPVHRSAFTPPPKVMSAVVHITPADHAGGRLPCPARTPDRSCVRPAPQDAAAEPEGRARRRRGAGMSSASIRRGGPKRCVWMIL